MWKRIFLIAIVLTLSILHGQKGFAALGMDGLVAYYQFDGNAMDATGNGNHSTIVGSLSWSDQGVLDGCLSVSRGHIQVGNRRDDNVMTYGRNQDFTWALWFKPSGSNNDGEMLLSRRRYNGDNDQVAMHISYLSDGRVRMAFSADRVPAVTGLSTSRCNDGNWHHVAVVRDVSAGKMRMYIDGILESEAEDNGWDFSAASSCRIGQEGETYGGNRQYHGLIDDVRIYNRALKRIRPELTNRSVSETVYFKTESPLGKWLNCRLVGPTKTIIDGTNMFTLEIHPVDYETNTHRYKWVAESWAIGDPNIQIALLLPKGCFDVSGEVGFEGREVLHGNSIPGKWIQFKSSDNAAFWRKVTVGELMGKAVAVGLGEIAGIAFTFASAAEAIGNASDEQEALRQFASSRYDKIGISLPVANRDICAAKIRFGLTMRVSTADRIGILLKADKRTAIVRQYDTQYHIIEFYLYPRN